MAKMKIWSSELSTVTNIFCAWPLLLVGIGGALGGMLGAMAWMLNVKIMKSDFIAAVTIPAVILTGIGAFAAYTVIVIYLALTFPEVFAR